jgi:hypothetical protein
MPPERFLQLTRAYTLLGLLPDSLDLRAVMEDMLSQQIAGYYDPDSATLYGVGAGPVLPERARAGHAQDQCMLDNHQGQAATIRPGPGHLEGQANYASIVMLRAPRSRRARFWEGVPPRATRLSPAAAWPPPAVLRVALSYLAGAEFMLW